MVCLDCRRNLYCLYDHTSLNLFDLCYDCLMIKIKKKLKIKNYDKKFLKPLRKICLNNNFKQINLYSLNKLIFKIIVLTSRLKNLSEDDKLILKKLDLGYLI